MITVLTIACLLATLAGIGIWKAAWAIADVDDRRPSAFGWCVAGLVFVVATCISGAIGFGIAHVLGDSLPERFVEKPSKIEALATIRSADSQEGHIEGGLFLIVGSVSGSRTYYYYVNDDGWLSPGHINGDSGVYVHEEARTNAVLETHDWQFQKSWFSLFALNDFGHTYYFRVPAGTVKRDFTLQ